MEDPLVDLSDDGVTHQEHGLVLVKRAVPQTFPVIPVYFDRLKVKIPTKFQQKKA